MPAKFGSLLFVNVVGLLIMVVGVLGIHLAFTERNAK
jgi:hypothetical protein